MKRNLNDINSIKNKILSLKGEKIAMNVNRGRKKIEALSGVVKDVYPSVFTVAVKEGGRPIQTFSYYDVLCGNVVIVEEA